jgi:hypothetical protein
MFPCSNARVLERRRPEAACVGSPFRSRAGSRSCGTACSRSTGLRLRVQRIVDRRFNRAHYDAEETVAAFTERAREAVDLDTIGAELVQIVQHSIAPAHVSLWLRSSHSER